jgi:hypothetical protein
MRATNGQLKKTHEFLYTFLLLGSLSVDPVTSLGYFVETLEVTLKLAAYQHGIVQLSKSLNSLCSLMVRWNPFYSSNSLGSVSNTLLDYKMLDKGCNSISAFLFKKSKLLLMFEPKTTYGLDILKKLQQDLNMDQQSKLL